MDAKLDNLIDKIKSEGVEEAQKKSEEIIKEAKEEADSIVKEAEEEAEQIKEDAKEEAEKIKTNGESALKQAQRDTILTTKEKLIDLFDNAFQEEIAEELDNKVVVDLILKVIETLGEDKDYEFEVNDEDLEKVRDKVLQKGKDGLKDGITFKPSKRASAGFKVKLEENEVVYDLTDEGLKEFLQTYLNPSIKEILEEDNG